MADHDVPDAGSGGLSLGADDIVDTPMQHTTAASHEETPLLTRSGAVRIGLWGGVHSGKTLFAGALQIAVNALGARGDGAGLRSMPMNVDASRHMMEAFGALGKKSDLPASTVNARDLRWTFSGKLQDPETIRPRLHALSWVHRPVQFELDLRDPPGIDYDNDSEGEEVNESIRKLISADGIIYLFDPIAADRDERFETLFLHTLGRLNANSIVGGRVDRYLPQRLAVCVTKFDDQKVFDKAVSAGLVFSDSAGQLRVPTGKHSQQFFELLCEDSDDSNALHLLQAIRNNFRPKSVRYYITSALGFSGEHGGGGGLPWPKLRRCPNVMDTAAGHQGVREQARPVNVIEPLLYLVRQTRRDRARVARRYQSYSE